MRSATGQSAGAVRGQRRLTGNRHRIVDQRLDAPRSQVCLHRRAIAAEHREQVIHVPGIALRWDRDRARRRDAAGIPPRARAVARSVHSGSQRRRARRTAACSSSSREFTPNSW